MSEQEKLATFGSWLTALKVEHSNNLYSLTLNLKAPVDAIRLKAGHLEATQFILSAFTELYKEPLQKFMVNRMGSTPDEDEEDKESDGQTDIQRGT